MCMHKRHKVAMTMCVILKKLCIDSKISFAKVILSFSCVAHELFETPVCIYECLDCVALSDKLTFYCEVRADSEHINKEHLVTAGREW